MAADRAPPEVGDVDILAVEQQGVDLGFDNAVIDEVLGGPFFLVDVFFDADFVIDLFDPFDGLSQFSGLGFQIGFLDAAGQHDVLFINVGTDGNDPGSQLVDDFGGDLRFDLKVLGDVLGTPVLGGGLDGAFDGGEGVEVDCPCRGGQEDDGGQGEKECLKRLHGCNPW